MSKLLKKPKEVISGGTAKYEKLNLKENPFPVHPFVNKENNDDRYNGRIYESRIREIERTKIIDNFIKVSQNNPSHLRLGYILDYSYVGRGNGKSAFTLNLINEINKEYCLDLSDEMNKCFGLHISPEPSGRTKTFYDFVDLIFDSIYKNNLIKNCLATLRLDSIMETQQNSSITSEFKDDEELIDKLNSASWFKDKEIDIPALASKIFSKTEFSKISRDFPLVKDKNKFYGYNIVTQEDFKKHYFEVLKNGKERSNFVFNDLVLFFIASGFNGSYIILDDFERIPDFQSEKQRQEFALEIRTNFFDGVSENAKVGFYNLILVLHAGVPRLVEKAWAVSGMQRRSPMLNEDGSSNHIIKFDKLGVEHAKLMMIKYLKEYRLNPVPNNNNNASPFTDDAIKLISEKAELNASAILEKSYLLIEEAAKQDVTEIDLSFVTKIIGNEDDSNNLNPGNIAKEESTDLFKKAKKE
jgi:hypothetical protein